MYATAIALRQIHSIPNGNVKCVTVVSHLDGRTEVKAWLDNKDEDIARVRKEEAPPSKGKKKKVSSPGSSRRIKRQEPPPP